MTVAAVPAFRGQPYRAEHEASTAAKADARRSMPGFAALLRWFLTAFREEMPEAMHQHDVWRDRAVRGDPDDYRPVGGSLLGSPRQAEPFRAFIEDGAFAVDYAEHDGSRESRPHYRTPMRAAIARLAGRGADHEPFPFMARALYRTALRDGDWDGACASLGIIEPVRRTYIEAALRRLWLRYEEEPTPRPYRGVDPG